jgi:hypothetical protein
MTAAETIAKNEKILHQIALAVSRSQGQFKLMRLRCDYHYLRLQWAERLETLCQRDYGIRLLRLTLTPDEPLLFSQLKDGVERYLEQHAELPGGIQVMGFETLPDRRSSFETINLIRETFRAEFSFPVLWWVDEASLIDLMKAANDLHSWSTGKQFVTDAASLQGVLREQGERLLERLEQGSPDQWVGRLPLLSESDRRELGWAQMAVKEPDFVREDSLAADLAFLWGRQVYEQENWRAAEGYWQQSLGFWQALKADSKADRFLPWVFFQLGLTVLKQAETDETRWGEAKTWFDRCLESWIGGDRFLEQRIRECGAVVLLDRWQQARTIQTLSTEKLVLCQP